MNNSDDSAFSIHPSVRLGTDVSIGPFAVIGSGVKIGDCVDIGAHAVIHENCEISDHVVIGDHAVVGKPPRLRAGSAAAGGELPPLTLASGVVVGAGAVVFTAAAVGERTIIGDQSFVRERAAIGCDCVVGRGSAVDCDVKIGDRVSIQTDVYVTARSVVEDDVFLGPGVSTTNDNRMGRQIGAARLPLEGPTIRRGARVGGRSVLVPGVEIGADAFVAAGAVVTKDVPPRTRVMGVPAREAGPVPDEDLLDS